MGIGFIELVIVLVLSAVLLLLLPAAIVFVIVKMLSGGSQQRRQATAEDARMIQEIHTGLSRMEERIESLETILVDQNRAKASE